MRYVKRRLGAIFITIKT
ncbi:unnamed protein product [Acanthoscelides obtectus]|uniref:Uncharacterized protein n=1 Tax=Acanthoscelides obtectus TaxID=200917 RepID=A0A9P0MF37_ACAOB|nr:unnamed protein product [Acanthoscelides obtectus]CAK1670101.1 hypothetical protein AOBTE_LOCUS27402 [Acanthoscelides obtectus]